MALTKKDIVDQIQGQLGFPKNQSVNITESLLELIKSSLEGRFPEIVHEGDR